MEYQRCGEVEMAAMKAGMNRNTAGRYIKDGSLPSEKHTERQWRTKEDPFAEHWPEVTSTLAEAPELEGKALFDWLCDKHPGKYQEGQLRTFQRHVRQWRAMYGPEKEVYFQQDHRPGIRMQTDFTSMNLLGITIGGVAFDHKVCHSVLPYSNWEWGTICQSESLLSLRKGIQAALVQLGHIPSEHWTDHSTAATHRVGSAEEGERGFNGSYLKLTDHFKMTPRTINLQAPNENGDVESLNGAFKRRVKQHILLRGNRNFENEQAYWQFLIKVFHRANDRRRTRLAEELAVMRPLDVPLLTDYVEEDVPVSRWSTIQTDRRVYSVPSRLIGETVRVYRHEHQVEVFLADVRQLVMPRLTGEKQHSINYRDIIEWLIRKPGAFAQYRFRTDLFPSMVFRKAYDRLCKDCESRIADIEYLRILRQAAQTMESDVEKVLQELEDRNICPRWPTVQEFWPQSKPGPAPEMEPLKVELSEYDALLAEAQS